VSFVQPWFLLGLLLGAVPILIHLINRRRAKPLEFSALEFLIRSDRRLARRLKLKEILLLVLRTLLIMALPVALARPYIPDESAMAPAPGVPRSVVVVVDRGLDRFARDDEAPGQAPLLRRTIEEARQVLRKLPAGSTAGAILADPVPMPLLPHLTTDRGRLIMALGAVKGRYVPADVAAAVRVARLVLSEEGLERAEVVVVGGLSDADHDALSRLPKDEIGLRLVQVRRSEAPENARIASVTRTAAEEGAPALAVKVESTREEALKTSVTLEMAGQVVRRQVELPPEGETTVLFALDASLGAGTAALEQASVFIEPDDFPPDDRFFVLEGGFERVNVLVVNGAPRAIPFQDETFFLLRALRSLGNAGLRLQIQSIAASAVRPADVAGRDVVILANVHLLQNDVVASLRSTVEAGAGLLVGLGEQSDSESVARMRDLHVLPVREIQGVDPHLGADQGLSVGAVDSRVQGAAGLAGATGASLRKARVFRYAILAPPTSKGPRADTWIRLENGAPLLVARGEGRGRLALMTTTLDLDWTDIPAHPGYVPLLGTLVTHLAARGEGEAPAQVRPGVPWTLRLPVGTDLKDVRVAGPGPEAEPVAEIREHDGALRVSVRDNHVPGFYRVWLRTPDGREMARRFTVNVERAPLPVPAEQGSLAALERPPAAGRGAGAEIASTEDVEAAGTPVWPFVLLALILLLSSEAYAALRV